MTNAQLYALDHRCIIRVGGEDRAKYLQGLITNDIDLLNAPEGGTAPLRTLYACMLTPQGKFLFEFFITKDGDNYLIDTEKDRSDELMKKLKLYKIRTKVELEMMEDYRIIARYNAPNQTPDSPQITVAIDPRHQNAGERIIVKDSAIPLTTLDGAITTLEDYDYHRISLGLPDGARDMTPESTTMSEARIDAMGGVSFTKGCYVGQELTARMHHRGLSKKHIYPLRSLSGIFPARGSDIDVDGKNAGKTCSSARDIGLAVIRDEHKPQIEKSGRFAFITPTPR